jgi:hypothetical protein
MIFQKEVCHIKKKQKLVLKNSSSKVVCPLVWSEREAYGLCVYIDAKRGRQRSEATKLMN